MCESFVTNVILDGVDAGVEGDGILLNNDLLLDESVDLLLEEVDFINVVLLKFKEVFLQVGDVFNDFLEDIVSSLSGVMLKSSAFASKELHFLLVIVQELDGFL